MKILVVDDELDVQFLFEQKFRKEIRSGLISFTFANSAKEALAYLQLHYSEVVLILSDVNMPGMSGLELLKQIKSTHPSPPPMVVITTAYNDADSYQQAMQLGADAFMTKPLDFTALKEKLSIA